MTNHLKTFCHLNYVIRYKKPVATINSPTGLFLPAAGKPAQPHTPLARMYRLLYLIYFMPS
jgi:hypothetical protein